MAARQTYEQRHSQPRDFMRVVPRSQRKHSHRHGIDEEPYETAYYQRQELSRDIGYDISSSSNSEELDSDAEYISHREQSQGDHIAPSFSNSRRRETRLGNVDHRYEEYRLPMASPPTRVPFATFDHERLESHRVVSRKSKSKQRGVRKVGKKKSKEVSNRDLETWGFGGHDEDAMSKDEQRRSHSRRPHHIVGEFPSSDLEDVRFQHQGGNASDIASIHDESESGSASDHAAPCDSTAPSSFSSVPTRASHKPPMESELSDSAQSDIEIDRLDPTHSSSFTAPLPRRAHAPERAHSQAARSQISRSQASHSSFSAPLVLRARPADSESDSASSSHSDIQIRRPKLLHSSFSAPAPQHFHISSQGCPENPISSFSAPISNSKRSKKLRNKHDKHTSTSTSTSQPAARLRHTPSHHRLIHARTPSPVPSSFCTPHIPQRIEYSRSPQSDIAPRSSTSRRTRARAAPHQYQDVVPYSSRTINTREHHTSALAYHPRRSHRASQNNRSADADADECEYEYEIEEDEEEEEEGSDYAPYHARRQHARRQRYTHHIDINDDDDGEEESTASDIQDDHIEIPSGDDQCIDTRRPRGSRSKSKSRSQAMMVRRQRGEEDALVARRGGGGGRGYENAYVEDEVEVVRPIKIWAW